jgi:nitrite reductase (NADH) large subunit
VALGLVLLGSTLVLRKRLPRFSFGKYELWQLLHVTAGAAAAMAVVVHTGFRVGARFNATFMLVFVAVLTSGAVIGALSLPQAQSAWARSVRAAHLMLVWLLPPLVAVHVLTVYYF